MDPDRVGTLANTLVWVDDTYVSNLYGSRQSRDLNSRVRSERSLRVSNLYGSRQSRDNIWNISTGTAYRCFQFIWIPTESGLFTCGLKEVGQYFVSNLYGSRQSRDTFLDPYRGLLGGLFPIYMDPDRVGT